MNGKNKCKLLKEIRQRIADENEIPYVTTECKFRGNCTGTCPKCEAEVRYLEQELEKRRSAGKKIAVAGIAAIPAEGLFLRHLGLSDDVSDGFLVIERCTVDDFLYQFNTGQIVSFQRAPGDIDK